MVLRSSTMSGLNCRNPRGRYIEGFSGPKCAITRKPLASNCYDRQRTEKRVAELRFTKIERKHNGITNGPTGEHGGQTQTPRR